MTEAYDGKTGSDYDALLDKVADACAADNATAIAALYHVDLGVPDALNALC